jgi:selenocysteine-specific elongation factor
MKHIILGTAGHIDHGKTALIKAITGVNTDRLKEEKERGITIELGFAAHTLENGQRIGIVDVPGHEKFVKNMVAGAGGIDLVVLVIAADEGVMPQTKEHLDICTLLGIKNGLVALTKVDLVDGEWIDLVKDDVREFLEGTFMEESPIVPLSAVTGEGLPEFLSALESMASEIPARADADLFRLPVDRVFTMKGFGTVVTGTLVSGRVNVGEAIEILPRRVTAKIRGIQVHNDAVTVAEAGQRTAINLQGVEKSQVQRGDILAHQGTYVPSNRFDILFTYLSVTDKKLKNRTLVRFHSGTSETISRIILIGKDEMEPGETGYAQVILAAPTVTMAGDRFVMRSYSPVRTIGGGEILDPLPQKHKRFSDSTVNDFNVLRDGTDLERVSVILDRAGLVGISSQELILRTGIKLNVLNKLLEEMFSKREAVPLNRGELRVVSSSVYGALREKILSEIEKYHEKFPLKEGFSKEELRTTLGPLVDPGFFNIAIKNLAKDGSIVIDRENVRISGHAVNLKGDLEELRKEIEKLYLESKLTPPSTKEALEKFADRRDKARNILRVMLNEGVLVKVTEEMYFHKDVLGSLREDYRAFLLKEGESTPASFRDMTGLSRKFTIPLMEYFDATKLTIRVGDHRVLRERKER